MADQLAKEGATHKKYISTPFIHDAQMTPYWLNGMSTRI